MFELACSECGHLFSTESVAEGGHTNFRVSRVDTAIHAWLVHALEQVEVELVWTALGAKCHNPKLADRCRLADRCYRPIGTHPSTIEQEEAAELAGTLFDVAIPAGAGFGDDLSTSQRLRRARQRAIALSVADGGHWILPWVRVRPTARHEIQVVRLAS